ncbi:enterochelin esterase-like enzyme/multisubunit Na+/H+ antiporter MnhB subunit [Crossiella equi]|uniref:Enterochelin esterase-like enzyme/multisubunit Na+/H+ antiporter MnhB subunit n=1 Tax=Crossiella equi TaxID=130796 RepID=A0ABS5ACT7_9PSEU|nr:alpha/beta hydrolase-fold protein [Crossiella equi]MBP2474403.1 enterochelin esterase-like enzyme/multisubunit Na+/H+ antiporter MnhB subunit [Crossiella equi]
MAAPLDWSLIDGPVPALLTFAGGAALAVLLYDGRRSWWRRVVPLVLLCVVVLGLAVDLVVNQVWRPFADRLPSNVSLWIAVLAGVLVLAVFRAKPLHWPARLGVLLCVVVLVVCGLADVNRFFGQFPTVSALLGSGQGRTADLSEAARPAASTVVVPPGKALSEVWQPPPDLPDTGTVSEVTIPSSAGFTTRTGRLYLPPAYQANPRPRLPVLVLLAGQPGSPTDWLGPGQLAATMDRYAAENKGLAPVVVLPDHLGSELANPLCVDSKLGAAETYLAKDVPAWIRQTLQVNTDPQAWAIGGLSQGGTCSLQLAVRAPEVYRSFVDIAGQREPSLGTRKDTVAAAFGGDEAAFKRVNPLDIMATTKFPKTSALIISGNKDNEFRPQQQEVYKACQKSGMTAQWLELAGPHNWVVWRPALAEAMPWLAQHTGLTPR